MTTELFLCLCRKANLTLDDLEIMTIGMCLDYMQEYIEINNTKKPRVRRATQSDFDSF